MQRWLSSCTVVATPGGLAIDGNEFWTLRRGIAHPAGEHRLEPHRNDPVHQDHEPTSAEYTVRAQRRALKEVEMRLTPGGDIVVAVAVGDGAAHDQQQNLGKRVHDPMHIARKDRRSWSTASAGLMGEIFPTTRSSRRTSQVSREPGMLQRINQGPLCLSAVTRVPALVFDPNRLRYDGATDKSGTCFSQESMK